MTYKFGKRVYRIAFRTIGRSNYTFRKNEWLADITTKELKKMYVEREARGIAVIATLMI